MATNNGRRARDVRRDKIEHEEKTLIGLLRKLRGRSATVDDEAQLEVREAIERIKILRCSDESESG